MGENLNNASILSVASDRFDQNLMSFTSNSM